MRLKIRKGLDLPVTAPPRQIIVTGNRVASVALCGDDYLGLKPRLSVQTGDRVRLGDPLFVDKRDPSVRYVAPGCGVVSALNRGARRVLHSIVIDLEGDDEVTFDSHSPDQLRSLRREVIRDTLLVSGLWTALRERPFSRVARTDGKPQALFVTAIDTQPLAADPAIVIEDAGDAFVDGLTVLGRLMDKPVYLCKSSGSNISGLRDDAIRIAEFKGPHPAGLVGTHIHFLEPVHRNRMVWHVNYQDVIAIGRLFARGRIDVERIVALGGPRVRRPRLLRTRLGASTDDLVADELHPGRTRVISGSLLNGRHAAGWARYLGRYHQAVAAIPEPVEREFLGWFSPGLNKFSANRVYVSHLLRHKRFALNTSQQGSPRAIVPMGHYEKVMPLDIVPTPLLKSLVVRDIDTALSLGCLELDEEDLALCSLVCCSKLDYGAALRASLDLIESES